LRVCSGVCAACGSFGVQTGPGAVACVRRAARSVCGRRLSWPDRRPGSIEARLYPWAGPLRVPVSRTHGALEERPAVAVRPTKLRERGLPPFSHRVVPLPYVLPSLPTMKTRTDHPHTSAAPYLANLGETRSSADAVGRRGCRIQDGGAPCEPATSVKFGHQPSADTHQVGPRPSLFII
jgi:hypothetical protein